MSEQITLEELEKLQKELEDTEAQSKKIEEKLIGTENLQKQKEEIERKKKETRKKLKEIFEKVPPEILGSRAFKNGEGWEKNPFDPRNQPEKVQAWFAGWMSENINSIPDPVSLPQQPVELDDEKLEQLVMRATKAFYKKEHTHWSTLYSKQRRKFYIALVVLVVLNFAFLWVTTKSWEPEAQETVVEQIEAGEITE